MIIYRIFAIGGPLSHLPANPRQVAPAKAVKRLQCSSAVLQCLQSFFCFIMVVTRRAAAAASASADTGKSVLGSSQPNPSSTKSNSRMQRILLLITLATGICACYLFYGLVQERLFSPTSPHGRAVRAVGGPITTFLVLTQAMGNTAVAALWTWIQNRFLSNQHGRRQQQIRKDSDIHVQTLNHKLLLLTAFCYFGAMASSNEAINWVSYPTVVLAKSSKLIPSMVAGVTLERRSYSGREWGGALLITSGIVVFNYTRLREQDGNSDARPDSPFGLLLLGISLMFDGALSACQGSIKRSSGRHRPPTAMEFMAYTNSYAFLFLLPACIVSGQLKNGMSLLLGDGGAGGAGDEGDAAAARRWILLLNATAAAGQVFIFLTIHCFSSIMCTTITTTRKFVSILLSVRHFGHVFSPVQWTSVGCVFVGLYMEIVAKISDGSSDGNNANNEERKRQ